MALLLCLFYGAVNSSKVMELARSRARPWITDYLPLKHVFFLLFHTVCIFPQAIYSGQTEHLTNLSLYFLFLRLYSPFLFEVSSAGMFSFQVPHVKIWPTLYMNISLVSANNNILPSLVYSQCCLKIKLDAQFLFPSFMLNFFIYPTTPNKLLFYKYVLNSNYHC